MDMLFGKVFSMSLTASLAIIAVILARIPLRKLPKTISYWLWAVVLFRLLCPVTLPSPVSFVPENLAQHTVVSRWSDTVTLNSDFEYPSTVTAENTHSQPVTEPEPHKVDSPVETPAKEEKSVSLLASLWTLGIAGMAAYTAFSRIRVSRKTRYAIRMGKGIYVAEGIPSPFVLGIVNPKIFLPENLSEEEQAYVIIHENYHIRHLDHIVKFLFYIALCIHWFNPFVWVAFLLFSRDMEMRCDEAVMKKLGSGIRANYCYSILRLSARQPLTAISFGGSNTKSRIKNLAMPKKTGMGVIALALVFTITLSACLATNPVSPTDMTEAPTKSPEQIAVDLKEKEAELRAIEAALALKEKEKDQAIWNEWMDSMPNNLSLNVYFVDNDRQKDTFPTYTYEGEELHIKVNVGFTGISEVGLLLFLNGKPQPCRLNEDTKYSYMTILDRPGSPHTRLGNQDLYFVPVDGVMGETVNLEVVAIANPNYFLEDGPSGFQYTGMPAADAAKVTFLQDPITVSQPTLTSRVLSVTEETKPLDSVELQKLQETVDRSFALAYDLPYRLWINGNRGSWGTSMGGQMYYSFSGGEPLEVILEVYGDSVGEYGFNLFVNNLPVSEEPLLIHTEEGTKTLVTVLLDMSDFDGSAVLYGTLAAKNYEGYRNPNGAVAANGVFETETFYFSDAKDIYDLLGIEYPF